MKQKSKMFSILAALCLFFSVWAVGASAETSTMSIQMRIEGIHANVYYKTVDIPYTDTLTVQQALAYIDGQEDGLTITGLDTGYITAVNGDTAGVCSDWAGWLYRVNGEDAAVGIDACTLKNNDSVVLYYGDPFSVGMQFPEMDTSALSEGVIRFTSKDTTYDADYNPVVTVNKVVGAIVTWSYGDQTAEYTTDDQGCITIDAAQRTAGAHAIAIAKVGDRNLPLVLRFAPDAAVTVEQTATTAATTTTTASVPPTGEATGTTTAVMLLGLAALAAAGYSVKRTHAD